MRTNGVDPRAVAALRQRVRGPIVQPGDETYDSARRIWNGMIDRHPAAIACCTGPADVMAGVRFSREHRLPLAVRCGTATSTVEVWALGGAISRVRPEATAFYHREAPYLLAVEANADDPATDDANIAWVRRRLEDAGRFSPGGTYFNFGGFLEGGAELLEQSFGANYRRIQDVKRKYDPENVFYHNLRVPVAV